MAGSPEQSDMNNPNTEERGRRLRIIWLSSIANLTLVVVLTGLWLQRAFPAQHMIILALALFLIVNGALWSGWRIDRARQRANRPLKPLFLLLIGGLAILSGIADIATKDYASGGMLLVGGIGAVGLGAIAMRSSAKRNVGESQQR